MRGMHHDEAAGGGIDDEVAALGNGADQASDQADRFNVWMNASIDLLRPVVANCMVAPGNSSAERWLLQHEQVAATTAGAIAVTAWSPLVVPGNQVDAFQAVELEMIAFAQTVNIRPQHQIAGPNEQS